MGSGVNLLRSRLAPFRATPLPLYKRVVAEVFGIPRSCPAPARAAHQNEIMKLNAAGILLTHIHGKEGLNQSFPFLTKEITAPIIDKKLKMLPCMNLSITIRDDVPIDGRDFTRYLNSLIDLAVKQRDLRGIVIHNQGGKPHITPEFWDLRRQQVLELGGPLPSAEEIQNQLDALIMLYDRLDKARSFNDIDKAFIEVMLLHLGASKVKLYDVDNEFVVSTHEIYEKHGEMILRTPGNESLSHFKHGLRPDQYQDENMHTIIFDSSSSILVVPTRDRDPRHMNGTLSAEAPFKPYVALRQQVEGKISRIIIVEVDDPKRIMGEKTITNFVELVNRTTMDAKGKMLEAKKQRTINTLKLELKGKRSVREVLKRLMNYMPLLFKTDGSFSISKITLLMGNPNDGSLQVREEWVAPGNKEESRRIGEKLPGQDKDGISIGQVIFDSGVTARCTSAEDFAAAKGVKWSRGMSGSLLGSLIRARHVVKPETGNEYAVEKHFGVMLITSPKRNMFTRQHEAILEQICAILGEALLETKILEDLLNLDPKFGIAYSAKYLKENLLGSLTKESIANNTPLGGIFFDIDNFSLINKLVGNEVVDTFIMKPFMEMIRRTKRADDFFARHGGDEFAMLCPNTNIEQAVRAAERLRMATKTADFIVQVPCSTSNEIRAAQKRRALTETLSTDPDLKILAPFISNMKTVKIGNDYYTQFTYRTTLSLGVSEYNRAKQEKPATFFFRLTDAAYIAKKGKDNGPKRNRVVKLEPED